MINGAARASDRGHVRLHVAVGGDGSQVLASSSNRLETVGLLVGSVELLPLPFDVSTTFDSKNNDERS